MRTIICILILALAFTPGCRARARRAARQPPSPAVTGPSHQLPGEWVLATLNGDAVKAARSPWIRIDVSGSLRGWGGVNQISSQLDEAALAGSEFKPSPIVATRMAGPPESMKLEGDFLTALQSARTYSATEQSLSLQNEAGGLIASFVRKSSP